MTIYGRLVVYLGRDNCINYIFAGEKIKRNNDRTILPYTRIMGFRCGVGGGGGEGRKIRTVNNVRVPGGKNENNNAYCRGKRLGMYRWKEGETNESELFDGRFRDILDGRKAIVPFRSSA